MATFPIRGWRGRVLADEPLALHTTWRIGGPARWLVEPADVEDLLLLINTLPDDLALMVIGGGSNLLAGDEGFAGVIVKLGQGMARATLQQGMNGVEDMVEAGGGLSTRALAHLARRHGLGGAEFLGGIPGSVGGAILMNAGAYGGEISQILHAAELLTPDGQRRWLKKEELGLGYRCSAIGRGTIVLGAVFQLTKADPDEIRQRMRQMNRQRGVSQPLNFPSAGSTFKNPPGQIKAWELIQRAGLSGVSRGDAQVAAKHCNFLINRGRAKAADMRQLIQYVRQEVLRTSGVLLELEVRILGPHGFLAGEIE